MNLSDVTAAAGAILLLLAIGASPAQSHKFINFDVPGATGTFSAAINDNNDVAGYYTDSSGSYHGFIRTSDGEIATFDAPQATSTFALSINKSAAIAGYFYDSSSNSHGFLRSPDGTLTTIDPPQAKSTYASQINEKGEVTGSFRDSDDKSHGFLRKKSGKFVAFDPDGSFGTFGGVISDKSLIAGNYCPISCGSRDNGFVRAADGTFATFSVEGAMRTEPAAINSKGAVAGRYLSCCSGGVFLRSADGQITTFSGCDFIEGLNNNGWIVGISQDLNSVNHGCLRAPDGTMTTFDDPNAGNGIGEGTQPSGINSARYITGYYSNSDHIHHGFIVKPQK